MIQYHIYPNAKRRIVTFSYDDGSANDERLISLFNKYGVKGTFHLNGFDLTESEIEKKCALYSGHEISCHTARHGWPARMPMQSVASETIENRLLLEKIAKYPVVGMSYPSGSFSDEAISAMRACGIVYSRTTLDTKNFHLPDDFMRWHPTCHHKFALELCDSFLENLDSQWVGPLFYIWGHSHEFRCEEDWRMIEALIKKLAFNDKIWYATNIDIYNYMTAQRAVLISADQKTFYNPTAIDVWLEKDKQQVIHIPAGKTVTIGD
ncbi:MAG: polysaccharide deacetylase family protein [Oscillospiraceae bacterium]|nr:polysaccharide deacetylase family protein [Oscillospiraceae bacterium]